MTEYFEVEKVLASKKSRGRTLYKIRWRTFGPEDDTWEPVSHLKGCQELLDEFHANQAPSKKVSTRLRNKVVANTETDASTHATLRTTKLSDATSRDVDPLNVGGGRRGLHNNGSYQRTVLSRESYTTAIHTTPVLNTGSLSKRNRSQETNISSDSNDDPPLSPLYAAMCVIGIALAIVFIYFTT